VEGALLLERPPLVGGGASCHRRELLAEPSHVREANVNIYKPHMVGLNGPQFPGPRMPPSSSAPSQPATSSIQH
jgi:hypothetical protein